MADISEWLAKLEGLTPEQLAAAGLTPEHVASAKKEHLLERDYTQKSQKVAALTKIQEQYPDLKPEDVIKVYDWYQQNAGTVREAFDLYGRRDRLVEKPEPSAERAAGKRKWRDVEAADVYETQQLREVFEDLHTDAANAGYQRWKDEYQKTEVPRLDQVANGMAATVLDLMDFALEDALTASRDPKHVRLDPREVLKRGAADGDRDFRKVATRMRDERLAASKPIEEDAFKRGLEEGKKIAEGPSGPLGGARPGWRPETTQPAPKTREELFQRVVSAVEQKSGRPVPL